MSTVLKTFLMHFKFHSLSIFSTTDRVAWPTVPRLCIVPMQALQSEQRSRSRSQCCTCTLYSWPEVPHAPVPYMPPIPLSPMPHTRALAACATRLACCWYLLNTFIFVVLLMYFFFATHLPLPLPPFCASHTCYASLLLLLTLTSSLTSHAGVLGAIPLCAAPRSAQLLRDVEYKRVEKSRVEQRYGERYTDGQKRKSKRIREQEEEEDKTGRDETRQRQKHSEKNARVRFVASDLRRGGGESIVVVVGGGRCVWNEE